MSRPDSAAPRWPGQRPTQATTGHTISRRGLLIAGGAGAAVLAASPLLVPGISAAARRAGTPGLHGATLSKSAFPPNTTFSQAIKLWEGYTGTTIQTSKVYYERNHFPTTIDDRIAALLANGIRGLLCFRPDFNPVSQGNLTRMEATLKLYKQAGLDAEVTIWQEPQVSKGHPSASRYIAAVAYYGPMIRQYYPLVYDASGAAGPVGWTQYYPGDDQVDKVVVDYYGHHYATGERIDAIAAIADSANPPKPFGIWEMGDRSSHVRVPTPAEMTAYFQYVQSLMAQRLANGRVNADVTWYNHGVSAIKGSSDFRVPLWQRLVSTTS
ncbi:MAG TPA: hypothetical protein VGS19_18085 [Streptosporangiaceae bacterium]|nr:hypothetical protein [Streptosporangiaceae bacterium]